MLADLPAFAVFWVAFPAASLADFVYVALRYAGFPRQQRRRISDQFLIGALLALAAVWGVALATTMWFSEAAPKPVMTVNLVLYQSLSSACALAASTAVSNVPR